MENPPQPLTPAKASVDIRPTPELPQTDRPPQLSLSAILILWSAAALPMPILAFWAAPALGEISDVHPGVILWCCMIAGMMWQFILAAALLWREILAGDNVEWRDRIWWRPPLDPSTRRKRRWLLLWVIPIVIISFVIEDSGLADLLSAPLLWLAPSLAGVPEPQLSQLADPALYGAWWLIPIALTSCIFNYVLGEALLFHGYMLPRMHGVFGKWDWLANGVLFASYHLIRPLTIPSIIVTASLWAWFSVRYRSVKFAVYAHAFDAIVVLAMTLAAVTGQLS